MGIQIAPCEGAIFMGKDIPGYARRHYADVSCAKMAEPIKMPFVLWTLVDPRNHALDVGPDRPKRRGNFGGKDMPVHARRQSPVSCAKMAEPTEMPFGLCGLWAQGSMCATWRIRLKSTCGGDAAFLSN